MSPQVLTTYNEMKLRTAPHILNIALAFTTNRSTVSEADISALLAFFDFITSEVEPLLAEAAGVDLAEARREAMKRHPAGKGR